MVSGPVTDQSLISQLEGGSNQPVTDPSLLSQLESGSDESGGGTYFGDVAKNVIPSAGHFLKGMGEQVSEGAYEMPKRALQSGLQMASGTPYSETPSGKQDTQFVQNAPEMASNLAQPYIHPINSFRNDPVNTTAAWAPIFGGARMASGAAREAFAGAEPNFLERAGARGINKSVGLSKGTVEDVTPYGENPGKFGIQQGLNLAKEGMAGKTPTAAWDVGNSALNKAGQDVDSIIQQVRSGGVEPIHDLSITEPIQSEYAKLANSVRSANKSLAPQWKETAQSLTQKADQNGGLLTFDDIRSEMQEVGELFDRYEPGTPQYSNNAKIYGKLADVRDAMVKSIADKNPGIADNLMAANQRYSNLVRVMPDISKSAAGESVKPTPLFVNPFKNTADRSLAGAKASQAMLRAGKVLRGGVKLADTVTAAPGKAAVSLFNKGKQLAGNEQGSIFPEHALPPGMKPSEMFTPAEQKFGVNQQNEQQYLANNDFPGALRSKWGMAANSGGSFTPEEVSVPEKVLTESKAREFLKKAKGDKAAARKMATDEGWSF